MRRGITREEATEKMRAIYAVTDDAPYIDIEDTHRGADRLMCEILRAHGYKELVDIFEDADKWYA